MVCSFHELAYWVGLTDLSDVDGGAGISPKAEKEVIAVFKEKKSDLICVIRRSARVSGCKAHRLLVLFINMWNVGDPEG